MVVADGAAHPTRRLPLTLHFVDREDLVPSLSRLALVRAWARHRVANGRHCHRRLRRSALPIAGILGTLASAGGCGEPTPSAAFEVTSSDGIARLAFPEGALSSGVDPGDIQVVRNEGLTADDEIEIRFSYGLFPDGLVLNEPAVFSMPDPFLPDETSFVRHDAADEAETPEIDAARALAGELAFPLSHFSDLTGLVDQRALNAEAAIQELVVEGPTGPLLAGEATTVTIRMTVRASGSVPDFESADGGVPSQLVWGSGGPLESGSFASGTNVDVGLDPRGGEVLPGRRLYTDPGRTAEYELSLTCLEDGTFTAEITVGFTLHGESVSPDGTRTPKSIQGTRRVTISGTCVRTLPLECPGISAPECRSSDTCSTGKICDDVACECVCSLMNGAACEAAGDCATGQACNDSCECECSVEAGGCVSDTDCADGGTCNTETCACEAPPACESGDRRYGRAFDLNAAVYATTLFCAAVDLASPTSILHSLFGIPERPVAHDHTTLVAYAIYLYVLSQLQVDTLFNNSVFECGAGPEGYTLCSEMRGAAVPPGDFVVLTAVVEGDVPLADPTNHYQYGFVFDADGDTTNNYQPASEYPNDFFQDTDLWYEASYQPSTGWALTAKTAVDGVITVVPTDARIIIRGDAILLIVPATELGVSTPSFRLTAFRHTGDYGIPAPHDFDGSLWPAVSDGLLSFP